MTEPTVEQIEQDLKLALAPLESEDGQLTAEQSRTITEHGERLHQMGGIELMHDTMMRVTEDADSVVEARKEGAIDRGWNGIGRWLA